MCRSTKRKRNRKELWLSWKLGKFDGVLQYNNSYKNIQACQHSDINTRDK